MARNKQTHMIDPTALRAALLSAATFTLEIEPEDFAPDGEFDDPDALAWVRDQMKRGNEWAWCRVKVTATVEIAGETYTGSDYLGGCSYESEKDFRGTDEFGYYPSMCSEAIDRIATDIESAPARAAHKLRVARQRRDRIRAWLSSMPR